MDKRIPYTNIPYFFNNIDEREPIAKIKVIYWKLKCDAVHWAKKINKKINCLLH